MPLIDMNEPDILLLQDLLRVLRSPDGARLLSGGGKYQEPELVPAPDIYIAYPQSSSGIPAKTASVGTGSANDSIGTVGEALCDIYRIVNGEIVPIGRSLTVKNVGGAISQTPLQVNRTKFGEWVAVVGGGECACTDYWIVDLRGGTAVASSGSFILNIFVVTETDGLQEVNITIDFDEDIGSLTAGTGSGTSGGSGLLDKLENEYYLNGNDGELIFNVSGGPLPTNGFVFDNKNLEAPYVSKITTLTVDNGLNNGVYPFVTQMNIVERS